jgi:hypothetical protein
MGNFREKPACREDIKRISPTPVAQVIVLIKMWVPYTQDIYRNIVQKFFDAVSKAKIH